MQNKTDLFPKKITPDLILRARRNYIVYRLKQEGLTIASFAKKLRVSPSAITNALRHSYPRVERALAKTLHIKVEDLFWERYRSDGGSFRRYGRPPKNKIAQTAIHRE